MALLHRSPEMIQVDSSPVISVAQQMAFYLSVKESEIEFISVDPWDDSCTISVNGECLDVFYNSTDSIVTNWIPAE